MIREYFGDALADSRSSLANANILAAVVSKPAKIAGCRVHVSVVESSMI